MIDQKPTDAPRMPQAGLLAPIADADRRHFSSAQRGLISNERASQIAAGTQLHGLFNDVNRPIPTNARLHKKLRGAFPSRSDGWMAVHARETQPAED